MKNPYLQEATEIIRKQQGPRGPVWMCGEQLLEMIAPDEAAAKLVLNDLKHGGMSLEGCEAKIREFAHTYKNRGCCTGAEALQRLCEAIGCATVQSLCERLFREEAARNGIRW